MEMRWFHYIRFGFIQHIQHIKEVPLTISEAFFVICKWGTMIWRIKRLSTALWITDSFEGQCASLSGVVVSPLKTRLLDNQHLPSLKAANQAQTWGRSWYLKLGLYLAYPVYIIWSLGTSRNSLFLNGHEGKEMKETIASEVHSGG
jgi:hypothetical protein